MKWIDNLWDESNKPACNKPVRICKPNSVSIDSFLKLEANVRTLLLDKKMTVERIGLTNFKFSSLMEMTKVHTSSQHSILAHMSSASKIRRNGKNGFQTCSAWKRTNIYPCCTWSVCSWYFSWSVATGSLSNQQAWRGQLPLRWFVVRLSLQVRSGSKPLRCGRHAARITKQRLFASAVWSITATIKIDRLEPSNGPCTAKEPNAAVSSHLRNGRVVRNLQNFAQFTIPVAQPTLQLLKIGTWHRHWCKENNLLTTLPTSTYWPTRSRIAPIPGFSALSQWCWLRRFALQLLQNVLRPPALLTLKQTSAPWPLQQIQLPT